MKKRIGRNSVMKSFSKFCEEISARLERPLHKSEIKFLKWIQERYEQEQKKLPKQT